MKIEILERFSDDGVTYHKGELREVSEQKAGYFCGLGWAVIPGEAAATRDTSPKTLDIHPAKNGVKSPDVGVK